MGLFTSDSDLVAKAKRDAAEQIADAKRKNDRELTDQKRDYDIRLARQSTDYKIDRELTTHAHKLELERRDAEVEASKTTTEAAHAAEVKALKTSQNAAVAEAVKGKETEVSDYRADIARLEAQVEGRDKVLETVIEHHAAAIEILKEAAAKVAAPGVDVDKLFELVTAKLPGVELKDLNMIAPGHTEIHMPGASKAKQDQKN